METIFCFVFLFVLRLFNRIYEEWKRIRSVSRWVHQVRFNRIYEEWKPQKKGLCTCSRPCSIESMRNGNSTNGIVEIDLYATFNRIYEEWKQTTVWSVDPNPFSSIESMRNGNKKWKPQAIAPSSFNRIYEEWKLDRYVAELIEPLVVQSNLWGMETRVALGVTKKEELFNRIYEEWKPTRYACQVTRSKVQSNLWGMETILPSRVGYTEVVVQSNLWGMETYFSYDSEMVAKLVQSNLWGMETGPKRPFELLERPVQSNLWGMETQHMLLSPKTASMFNRIYEEWKQHRTLRVSST